MSSFSLTYSPTRSICRPQPHTVLGFKVVLDAAQIGWQRLTSGLVPGPLVLSSWRLWQRGLERGQLRLQVRFIVGQSTGATWTP